MEKRVILITGTPCTGKTTIAKELAKRQHANYINLTELAEKEKLTTRTDKQRKTAIINENKMRTKLTEIINKTTEPQIVIDGHYAAAVAPKNNVSHVFVLRRNPVELRQLMEKCGFQGAKLWENLASEILDVCLVDALHEYPREIVCELDVTGKPVEAILTEIIDILDNRKTCSSGCIDWIGTLENQGILDEYLKI